MADDGNLLCSVRNAIRLLREFSQEEPELGITELSQRLKLHKSTVFRLLHTLCEERIIKQNGRTKKYSLYVGAFEIGSVFYHEIDICTVAFPLLNVLAQKLNEVVQLAMYDNGDVVYLLKFPEDDHTVLFNGMGRRVPCHCTAVGKLLLAYQDKREVQRVLQCNLRKYTQHTVTNPSELQDELKKIPARGFAESKEEFRTGMVALAAPVFDDITGHALAAISVTEPAERYQIVRNRYVIDEVRKCSELITLQLEAIRWKRRKFI